MGSKSNEAGEIISLPKGGGAVRGMGETFAPDLFTGTGNFTVPLELPSGRNGFQPQLNLGYSTGNGNDLFGLGWNLSIPGLRRKTSDGIPRYADESLSSTERDTFVLSGVEDLVPVIETDVLTRYRPRTEGLFARIEHHHHEQINYWRVHSKDGFVSTYGSSEDDANSESAVVADPADRSNIFSWKLTQTVDPFGNRIQYEYERDSAETAEHHWDQIYLKRIRYADYDQSLGDGGHAERFLITVSFMYEERPDPFSDFRAGFEIRTMKRCARIEIRTHADRERLARTYHLVYLDQRGTSPEQLPLNGVSLLAQILVEGHEEERRERLPPLEFGYTAFEPTRRRYQPFTAASGALPEQSLAHPEFALVDLFGNGLPDVIQMNGVVRYWRNLGGSQFDLPRTMTAAPPSVHLGDAGVQFADANGDGRADLLVLDGVRDGYYPLTFEGTWDRRGFVRYAHTPAVSLNAPEVRMMDLDGDGVTDALRTGASFELYYNDPLAGWARTETRKRVNSDSFPNISFTDARVKLGDLTGDGLQDIMLVYNGRAEYWPYLGYGRWGRRILMRNSPRFSDAAFFPGAGYDPKRLLLGDVDGDGLADLIYVSSGHVTVWINKSGNAWSDPIVINGTPTVTDADSLRLADMLGNGTDGILWTFDFATQRDSTYTFLDLTGGVKPYLLDRMDNHLGAVTKVAYASSTRFYLEDQERRETRWRTTLPFPVQVVARVEMIDELSRGKLTSEHRYHHGYWDGIEREFRGFGMVEHLDTEVFADDDAAEPPQQFSPPTLSRIWFHQGPVGEAGGDWFELDWSADYWPGDPAVLGHTLAVNAFLQTLTDRRSKRDALRSLRGSVLRAELYALDGSVREQRPYTVSEHAYGLREESAEAVGGDRPRIFFPHIVAERTTQWERGDEPLTSFSFSDGYDAHGYPRSQIALAVPRGRQYAVSAAPGEPYLGVQTTTIYCGRDDAQRYFVDRVSETAAFQIVNDGSQPLFDLVAAARDGSATLQRVGQSFNYYDGEAFAGLPFGQVGDFGALVRTETLVLTEEILAGSAQPADPSGPEIPLYLRPDGATEWTGEYPEAFRARLTPLAGYDYSDGTDHRSAGYFAQAARLAYDFQRDPSGIGRGLHAAMRDPLNADTTISYDRFQLFPVAVTDAVGLTTTIVHDYRVLKPREVTDANGNRTRLTYTPIGLPDATYVAGKVDAGEGDEQKPGTRFVYDLLAFQKRRQPISVRAIRREHHDTESDVAPADRDATIETVEYSDGFGRVLQTRSHAEDVAFGDEVIPGDQNDAQGTSAAIVGRRRTPDAEPNVVVSGWRTYDNKGRAVEQFEPFFSAGWRFSIPAEVERGEKVSMFYDPRGQLIRTVNPDGSEQRIIYGVPDDMATPDVFQPTAWEVYVYDANDNAGRTHADESHGYRHHWNTPSNVVIDGLGRTVLAVDRNRASGEEQIEEYHTRSTYDIRGNLLTVTDAEGRQAFTYLYDLGDQPLRIESIDAGVRRMVLNAAGKEIERRDSKGALVLQAYDALSRSSQLWARTDDASPVTLLEVIEYGDGGDPNQSAPVRAAGRAANRLGRIHRHYDEAGLLTIDRYDFKGNTTEKLRAVVGDEALLSGLNSSRNTLQGYRLDWQPRNDQSLEERAAILLDPLAYLTSTTYDALNRMTSLRYPRDSEGERKQLRPRYNNGGALERVEIDDAVYVAHIAYDAKRHRTLIALGNGVMTRYAYDPRTFRLRRLRSEAYTRPDPLSFQPTGSPLQDCAYAYDLAGNILRIVDRVPGCGVLDSPGSVLESDPALRALIAAGDAMARRFEYDAISRLTSATGRESKNLSRPTPWDDDPGRTGFNSPNHGTPDQDNAPTLTSVYKERYEYDPTGNVIRMRHTVGAVNIVRRFNLAAGNNRLRSLTVGEATIAYRHDANGNMAGETASRHFTWDHRDQMSSFRVQAGDAEPSVHALYLYDAGRMRVKKFVRRQGGQTASTVFIDDVFEHHRWRDAAGQIHENNYLHVLDDHSRVALVRVGQAHPDDRGPDVQYHLGDHLGSSSVIVEQNGSFVNREEYTPYGESVFGGFARKRYRFTGKERDEESGLSYHGARFYAVWLARWLSADPVGMADGINLYAYVRGNPIRFNDPMGNDGEDTADNLTCDGSVPWESYVVYGPFQSREDELNAVNDFMLARVKEESDKSQWHEDGRGLWPTVKYESPESADPEFYYKVKAGFDDDLSWFHFEVGARLVEPDVTTTLGRVDFQAGFAGPRLEASLAAIEVGNQNASLEFKILNTELSFTELEATVGKAEGSLHLTDSISMTGEIGYGLRFPLGARVEGRKIGVSVTTPGPIVVGGGIEIELPNPPVKLEVETNPVLSGANPGTTPGVATQPLWNLKISRSNEGWD